MQEDADWLYQIPNIKYFFDLTVLHIMCVFLCGYMYVPMCVHVCDAWHLFSYVFSTLYFQAGSLSEPGVSHFAHWLVSLLRGIHCLLLQWMGLQMDAVPSCLLCCSLVLLVRQDIYLLSHVPRLLC